MTVLVCGGRDYHDQDKAFRVLDEIHAETPIDRIVEGGCSGADDLAYNWRKKRKVHGFCHAANWRRHGKSSGPIRNAEMIFLHAPDLVVAFPGGVGTRDMIYRAERKGVRVIVVEP